jgi:O-antigen ligase
VVGALVAGSWQQVTSTNRYEGGVASKAEVEDRLNADATAFWAIERKPVYGWGIGRFPTVNTIHHKAWGNIDWNRGYGIAAHDTQLGIAAELGLLGLGLWIAILIAIGVASRRAWRALPRSGLISRGLVLMFWCAGLAWLVDATTADMRFFVYVNGVFFVWAGMIVGLGDRPPGAPAPGRAVNERVALAEGPRGAEDALGAGRRDA